MKALVEELRSRINLQNNKLFEVLEFQYGLSNNDHNYHTDQPVIYSLSSDSFVLIIHDQRNPGITRSVDSISFVAININSLTINSPLPHFKLINKRKHEIYEPIFRDFLKNGLENIVKIVVLDNKICRSFVEHNCNKMICPIIFSNNPFNITYKRAAHQYERENIKKTKS